MQKTLSFKIIIFIVISMLGPLSLNMFLPALPIIRQDLHSTTSVTQLTLSLAMLSFAIGTFLNGFISDRIGRKPTLIIGLCFHITGNVICMFAGSITGLIIGRIIMTYGGSGIAISVRAGISDIYGANKAASAYALIAVGIVFVPMLAPSLGGYVTALFSWRAVFTSLAVVGIIFLITASLLLKDTETKQEKLQAKAMGLPAEIKRILMCKKWWIFSVLGGLMPAISFTFMSIMPYISQDMWGFTPVKYGNWLIVSSLGYFGGSLLSIFINKVRPPAFLVLTGGIMTGIFSLLLFSQSLFGTMNPIFVFGTMCLLNIGIGLVQPTSIAQSVNLTGIPKGAAASMQGLVQTGMPVFGVQIAGATYSGGAIPSFAAMAIFGVIAFGLAIWGWHFLQSAKD